MDLRTTWTFNLVMSKEEFRIISKALRGVLITDAEKNAALDLQRKMLKDKHSILTQALAESQKAIDNIDASE